MTACTIIAPRLIDFRQGQQIPEDPLPTLQAQLLQLVGEPFQFARVSYGDELTLHFGEVRAGRKPKSKHKAYGAYILGLRASPWLMKSDEWLISAGVVPVPIPPATGKQLTKDDLEKGEYIKRDSRVLAAIAFAAKPADAYGLQIAMSDGKIVVIIPQIQAPLTAEEEAIAEDEKLPEIADWELQTPQGLFSIGPGLRWTLKPKHDETAKQGESPKPQ
jgi:hypothetical protein